MRKPGINYSRYFVSSHGQKQFMRPRYATVERNTQNRLSCSSLSETGLIMLFYVIPLLVEHIA